MSRQDELVENITFFHDEPANIFNSSTTNRETNNGLSENIIFSTMSRQRYIFLHDEEVEVSISL
uniref:Uncharacterized protein n=1 Tax=Arion vulgaris TaxID=1028688 RepID=A0A0B7BKC6_9EUPU